MTTHRFRTGAALAALACLLACGQPIADPDTKLANDAIEGSVGGVRLALAAGADPDHGLPDGKTVLMWVCARLHATGDHGPEIIGLLIDAGADVNARADDGSTALGWAANSPSLAAVRRLVDAGAAVNVGNERGWTPLMAAANWGDPAVVEYLLAAGADPLAVDAEGRTALAVAEERENDVVEILRAAMAE